MATRWIQFLVETIGDADLIRELQEFFGQCLDQEPGEGRALVLSGEGSNGKTVLVEVLAALVGKDCVCYCERPLSDRFGLAHIVGRRLVVSRYPIAGSLLKRIVQRDLLEIERKYQDPEFYRPECNVVFEFNRRVPGFAGRRVLSINLDRAFVGPDRDPRLLATLLEELDEIRAWSLVGLERSKGAKRG